ncbi:MAG: di-trans,poly-cis-decaprenylcistransferase, partial [Clostridia bacterium]|nr:di-trans,poly-cis-decaprenylcistransferase [Clostridia bacterium]
MTEKNTVPRHVAVIMDGNGRWAQKRGLSRINGHIEGAKNVPAVAEYLFSAGVGIVTLYAFSEENFSRPAGEVNGIFERILRFAAEYPSACKGRVRLFFSGDLEGVGEELRLACLAAEEKTRQYAPYALNVLVNYGGRSEILRAARMLSGKEVTAESFRS